MHGRYHKRFQPHADFLAQACDFPVVVIATFPEHHTKMLKAVRDKRCPGQRFVLMIHNPDVLFAPPSSEPPTCDAPLARIWVHFGSERMAYEPQGMEGALSASKTALDLRYAWLSAWAKVCARAGS